MKTLEQAQELARSLVSVGNELGVKTSALITDMNQPLGRMIGNAVEIDESVEVLKGGGPADVVELTLELCGRVLVLSGAEGDLGAARTSVQQKIDSGVALERLREMVKQHGGDLDQPRAVGKSHVVKSAESGFVNRINAERLGLAVIEMDGGRKQLGDQLDHSSGIEFLVRLGDQVEKDQPIANVFCDSAPKASYACELVGASVGISEAAASPPELIVESI